MEWGGIISAVGSVASTMLKASQTPTNGGQNNNLGARQVNLTGSMMPLERGRMNKNTSLPAKPADGEDITRKWVNIINSYKG